MLKIYFLRHGTTLFNEKELVQGWNDSVLTENGTYQARCAGYGARDIRFDKCYSGDCDRQIQTAKLFLSENNSQIEIIPDMLFREMNYGKYQGNPYINMLEPLFKMHGAEYAGYPELYKYMNDIEIADEVARRDDTGVTEGTKKVWIRFKQGLDRIIKENNDGNILLSTSSLAIAVVITNLFPDFAQNGLVDNCSLTEIAYENGEYKLIDYNNTQYRKIGEENLNK